MVEYPEYYTEDLSAKISSMEKEGFTPEKTEKINQVISFLDTALNEYVLQLHRELYASPGRRVAWRLINTTRFGGFAYSHSDSQCPERDFDFIGINLGTLCILYDNFTHLLSSDGVYIGAGDWHNEDSSRSSSWLTTIADNETQFTIPLCPVRAEIAKILTLTALRFLIIHESTHLYNGHLDWIKSCGGKAAAFIDDFPETVLPKGDLVRHYFEFDADNCALKFTVAHALTLSQNIKSIPIISQWQREAVDIAYGSLDQVTHTIIYSLYVLFRCTDPMPWDEKNIGEATHPRELLRARFMLDNYLKILGKCQLYNESMMELALATVLSAEVDLANMVGRPEDVASVKGVFASKLAREHIAEVAKLQWRLLHELAPFVRGDKFPRPAAEFVEEKRLKPYVDL